MPKNLLLASTSTLHGEPYLGYLLDEIALLFKDADQVVFVPYARPRGTPHETYTRRVRAAFQKMGIKTKGIHEFAGPVEAIQSAQGIFTGGGNTFVLVKQLYTVGAMGALREKLHHGTPYLGTSAGSNICGPTMQTTNDMPIVRPPSFKTLGLVPFNINPHYLDPDPSSSHMGETREVRIKEFHSQNTVPVIGLREGSWLRVKDGETTLKGKTTARVFKQGKPPFEVESGAVIDYF
ncbi:MAG: dipeptidase PepE [Marinirhabdus sp.]